MRIFLGFLYPYFLFKFGVADHQAPYFVILGAAHPLMGLSGWVGRRRGAGGVRCRPGDPLRAHADHPAVGATASWEGFRYSSRIVDVEFRALQ